MWVHRSAPSDRRRRLAEFPADAKQPVIANVIPTVYKVFMSKRAMQEATFLILTALAASSQHGYGILTNVNEISGGRVRLRAGTLYTALDRLRADGLVEVDREEIVEGRLRRYYRLTPAGSDLLADEAARMQANAQAALSRLRPAGGMTWLGWSNDTGGCWPGTRRHSGMTRGTRCWAC